MFHSLLDVLFSLFVGHYAPMVSGALGIAGSLALASPPIRSNSLRTVVLKLDQIDGMLSKSAHKTAKSELTQRERKLLNSEKGWNLLGAVLLLSAFAILFLNSAYCDLVAPGTCH
jgi:hypothetical protein